ncbi:cell surface protein [Methanosarcina siciliae C2J]|uniref:Cell surface protein n=1 Tax=Methanosarcina siciliae C2J TaxID=1434118 RepID=A0A0E3PPU2_9EURY|nr:PGF-pre-PGF domain-containing protein [Methanosarcina siciliae]AKB36590.1 cell surface protein [Methanosarcina siciliae C2J]
MKNKVKLYSITLASIAFVFFFFISVSSTALAVSTEGADDLFTLTETRINTNESSQCYPAIHGNRIVWHDSRNDNNLDIYMYDLSTSAETRITDNEYSEERPDIFGDKIVWGDNRNGNSDIYMYNISTKKEIQITTNESDQYFPSIYDDRIVWVDLRNGYRDIYMYNLSSSEETQITTDGSDQIYPAIYGDIIVWSDGRNREGLENYRDSKGNWDIYMYNLSTSKETRITTNESSQIDPSIYGNKIVWTDSRNGKWDIYMYDLSMGQEIPIITNKLNKYFSKVYRDRIVYQAYSNDNTDIYMYDLFTSKETRITTNKSSQWRPDIYENRIVWEDWRNGNPDIYMTTLCYIPVASFSANPTLGAAPLKVSFNDTSTGSPTTWNWSFGDGTYSTSRDTVHTYSKAENYIVNFTASNENGTNSTTQEIIVLEAGFPVADFSANVTAGYAPLDVQFTDLSQNEISRIWDFGDGTSSTDKNPIHTYSMVGKYAVNLTVNNTNGTVSKSSMITVIPVQHVDGQFIFTETRITTNESVQDGSAIYGNRIVWDDWRNGNGDVYMYDTSTSIETQITTNRSCQMEATIYEDKIIWIDGRNQDLDNYSILGNFDIWMYNLSTREETRVTTSESYKHHPKIYYDKIVWEDWRNGDWDIYMYNISTSKETRITNSGSAYNPDIYGDRIVWVDYRNNSLSGNSDIYMYDISTSKESQITTNATYQFRPIIYKDRIAWTDWRNGGMNNSDIYMYDISTSEETQITTNGSVQLSPAIYEDKIVWEDRRNGRGDIYVYDFSALKESRVTLSGRAYSPVIYGDKIVWTDWRNENPDIFMCKVEDNLMDTEEKENSGTHGGHSSGSSGGGGGSPEPQKNVEVKELSQVFIANGKPIKFDFTKNATCVVSVSFNSKKTVGKTTTIVEMLKNQSTLTPDLPEGEVYNYLNIWVGNNGYATEKNIENAVVCFRVEKSWMQDKGIDKLSITLNRYSDKKWNELPTALLREDDKYLYFTAQTPGFSPFAIAGKTIVEKSGIKIRPESDTKDVKNNGSSTIDVEQDPEKERSKSMPGFEIVYGVLGLLGIFRYTR